MARIDNYSCLFVFLISFLIGSGVCLVKIDDNVVNTLVRRHVNLVSHLSRFQEHVTITNRGTGPVTTYIVTVEPTIADNLSFIGAVTVADDDDDGLTLPINRVYTETGSGPVGVEYYQVDLSSRLAAGEETQLTITRVFVNIQTPFPTHIKQSEKQLVTLSGNYYYYSPYETVSQSTIVTVPSTKVESYSKPATLSGNTITYGPYADTPAYSEEDMKLHFENNNPFLAVTRLVRTIEISHWGNIAVEENIDIRHNGAILKGPFSRFDYQRVQDGVSSVNSFKTILPAAASDVYYRDEIGNISTSALLNLEESVELELRPRFPLFGGWRIFYTIGYNIPSYEYLYTAGEKFVLKMRYIDHIYDDFQIDEVTLRIILPECASDMKFRFPFEVELSDPELRYTYLDTVGRPVVIAKKYNLVEEHIEDFELHYTYNKMMMIQEPLLIVVSIYLLLSLVIICVRLDFSITKDVVSESRLKIAGIIDRVLEAQDSRVPLYQRYDDAITKFKISKDSSAFTHAKKKLDTDYKTFTSTITNLQKKLKDESSDVAEKVGELQRCESSYKELVGQAISVGERLVHGKISKNAYLDQEASNLTKRTELRTKIDTLIQAL